MKKKDLRISLADLVLKLLPWKKLFRLLSFLVNSENMKARKFSPITGVLVRM
jgi:hypothetical protein